MRALLFSSLSSLALATQTKQSCPTVPSTSYDLIVDASTGANISIPPLPSDLNEYSYATDNALVAVPKLCAKEHASKITKAADLPNKNACDPQGMQYVRIGDISGGWATVQEMAECSQGLVVGFHGTGGPGWGQAQYAAIFSGMGYVHIQLDSQSMPEDMGLKGKTPVKAGEDIKTDDYCGSYKSNTGKCGKFNKPYCYSSKKEIILANGATYRTYVEGVFQIRKRETDYFMSKHGELLDAFATVYAVGNSEGAMILSRYYHPKFHGKLKGMIIDGWSCEFNYFTPCAAAAQICEDKCDKSIPVLNVIGAADEYFGVAEKSLSQRVATDAVGYGASPITGNCHAQFKAQGFESHTTAVVKDIAHTPKYWSDNLVRAAVGDFVSVQTKEWTGKYKCEEDSENPGLFNCDKSEFDTCMPGWTKNAGETCECCDAESAESDNNGVSRLFTLTGSTAASPAVAGGVTFALFSFVVAASLVSLRRSHGTVLLEAEPLAESSESDGA